MRMMMVAQMDTEAGSKAIAAGEMAQLIGDMLGTLNAESAYFGPLDGVRTAFVVFDLQDPSQLPSITEPLFSKAKAKIRMFPVMDREALQKGLQQVAS
jgi:hypothetical protein